MSNAFITTAVSVVVEGRYQPVCSVVSTVPCTITYTPYRK